MKKEERVCLAYCVYRVCGVCVCGVCVWGGGGGAS